MKKDLEDDLDSKQLQIQKRMREKKLKLAESEDIFQTLLSHVSSLEQQASALNYQMEVVRTHNSQLKSTIKNSK